MSDRHLEFFSDWGPRLTVAVAAEFRDILAHVPGRVYAAAIAHAQGGALRLDVNTVEHAPELLSEPRDLSDDSDRDYRWWPDEWQAVPFDELGPSPTTPLVREWDAVQREVPEEEFDEFVAQTVAVLVEALGSASVRAEFAAHGDHPILVVTETDDDYAPSLASLVTLNADHPDQQLYADALTYWTANAEQVQD
jgi:hypothetical protein